MSNQSQQFVASVLASEKTAASVGVGSVLTAVLNNVYDWLHPVLSLSTLAMGLILSYVLYRNRKKKGKLMDQELILMKKEVELRDLKINSLKEKENHR
jgi:uncharacterized membrane protein